MESDKDVAELASSLGVLQIGSRTDQKYHQHGSDDKKPSTLKLVRSDTKFVNRGYQRSKLMDRQEPVIINPPTNEDFFRPISVKDKSWGIRKIDIKGLQSSRIKQFKEQKPFSKVSKEKSIEMTGKGFLDHPDKIKDEKKQAARLMELLDRSVAIQQKNLKPIREADYHIKGLKVNLLDHQVHSLRFFVKRETLPNKLIRGGLLCDDMGLGKTIQMISLIIANRATGLTKLEDIKRAYWMDHTLKLDQKDYNKHIDFKKGLQKVKTTLVVCPASLITQWYQEITEKSNLTCYQYHGSNRIRDILKLAKFDVVITSYQTCMADFNVSESPLYKCYWWRIILDEAHKVKNTSSKTAIACFNLKSLRRWCLTGTPVQNNVGELWSLLHFLRINKYWERSIWDVEIGKNMHVVDPEKGFFKLEKVLDQCMIRRKKNVLKKQFKLPPKKYHRVFMDQIGLEKKIYKNLEGKIIDKIINDELVDDNFNSGVLKLKAPLMKGNSANGKNNSYMAVFVYLLRLRQACSHWRILFWFKNDDKIHPDFKTILPDYVDKQVKEENKPETIAKVDDSLSALTKQIMNLNIKEEGGKEHENEKERRIVLSDTHKNLDSSDSSLMTSVKVKKVLNILQKNPKRKTIIFSEFTQMLKILAVVLARNHFECLVYDGSLNKKEKQEVLDKMKNESRFTVLLCSLRCGSLGLNLTFCSQIILYEPFWNPAVSAQAIDRVYRIGQKSEVDVWEFFVNDSVESRIHTLQEKKKKIAKAVTDKDTDAIMELMGNTLTKRELMLLVGVPKEKSNDY